MSGCGLAGLLVDGGELPARAAPRGPPVDEGDAVGLEGGVDGLGGQGDGGHATYNACGPAGFPAVTGSGVTTSPTTSSRSTSTGMFGGPHPEITTNLARLEEQATERLSPDALGYVVASAGSGSTARANVAAFERWRIVPRMLRDHAERDLSTTVLGTPLAAPVLLGPGRRADPGPPRRRAGHRPRRERRWAWPTCTRRRPATPSRRPPRRAATAQRWFQLYWPTDPALLRELPAPRRRRPATPRWSSPSTPRCWATARPTSTAATCRSWPTRAWPTTPATRSSSARLEKPADEDPGAAGLPVRGRSSPTPG